MRRIPLVLIAFALTASVDFAAPALKERKADDRERILGQWIGESLSVHGAPPAEGRNYQFRFSKDGTCGITNGGRGEKENEALYTLEPTGTPRRMKWLNGAGRDEWQCLYEFDGDRLRIAFVDQRTEAPNKIEPAANLTIYYLKRQKQ